MRKLIPLLLLVAGAERGATWTVCKSGGGCDYTTINAAIQDSANVHCGDTVQIKAGQGDGNGSNGTPAGWYCGGSGSCTTNNPVLLTQACPADNRITITTDQAAKLPPLNVRITPAYADGASPVIPTIYNPGNGMVMYAQPGNGGAPASGYDIVGIQFCCSAYGFSDFMPLGSEGVNYLDPKITTISDLPHDITLDHVIVRCDPLQAMRRAITFDAPNMVVENSWVDACFDNSSSDAQAINGFMGNGSILNNYISGTTETFSFGGATPPVIGPIQGGVKTDSTAATSMQIPGPLEGAWNDVTKPSWLYASKWTATSIWPKGQMLLDSAGDSAPVLAAQSTCTTGATEPVWPGSVGGSVTDGSCTWVRIQSLFQGKNLWECKSCVNVTLEDNDFHSVWSQGQQGYVITLTSSPSYTTQQRVNGTIIRNNFMHDAGSGINTNGMDAGNDVNALPSIMTGEGPWNIGPSNDQLSLLIDGTPVTVTLTNGAAQTAANVQSDLTTAFAAAGVGLACPDNLGALIIRGRPSGNSAPCGNNGAGGTQLAVLMTNTITVSSTANDAWPTLTATLGPGTVAAVEGTAYCGCQNPRTLVWYGCGQWNGLRVQNNLFTNINSAKFFAGISYIFIAESHQQNIQFAHNTVQATYGKSNPSGAGINTAWLNTTGPVPPYTFQWLPYNVLARDNIVGWNTTTTSGYIAAGGSFYDFSALNYFWGQPAFVDSATGASVDATAPAGIFSHNILPGITPWSATTRNTSPVTGDTGRFSYPLDNYNSTPTFDSAWRLTNPPGPATDQGAVGADPSTIPRILNASIQTSDRAAVLTYQVTPPVANSGYGCIAYVTDKDSYYYAQPVAYDTADSTAPIADQDPSQFTNPGWDGNDKFPQSANNRVVIIGQNAALSPSSTYYLRLQCPGASWPEASWTSQLITTNAAESGTHTIQIQRTAPTGIGTVASMKVTYGTSYSRASGVISGGGTASASCTSGTQCKVSITATAGQPLYEQVQYLDGSLNVLYSGTVSVVLP